MTHKVRANLVLILTIIAIAGAAIGYVYDGIVGAKTVDAIIVAQQVEYRTKALGFGAQTCYFIVSKGKTYRVDISQYNRADYAPVR